MSAAFSSSPLVVSLVVAYNKAHDKGEKEGHADA